jgi:hypothetical protein
MDHSQSLTEQTC